MKCEDIEVQLSGYLDGELTQQEAQRVRVHLDDCPHCKATLEELQSAKSLTRGLELQEPSAKEWEKMETIVFERVGRGLGWIILVVWIAVTGIYGSYQYASSPDEPLFQKILVFGILLGLALVFLSILSQRIRESRTDRYRGVLK